MAKGSQLSQLKNALNKAGITSSNSKGTKRKRGTPSSERDRQSKTAKLEEIQGRLNPFDVKVTKLKHDVGGRKLKGVTGKPAKSKLAGIEQRKKTLLKEYDERDHTGGIIDRRFGENDPSMSLEERMLQRFTKERQRASKGSLFNLEDEDELTHYGQSLSKLDDFDDVGLNLDDDEDDDPGLIDAETVKTTHFGGFGGEEDEDGNEPPRKKSKAEVMAEVIAKSKEHKIRRQVERDEGENVRHELDQAFDSIRNLLTTAPDALEDLATGESVPTGADELVGKEELEYDQRVRELVFDQRAKPKDRLKTEEELALEEKERLEKAERDRQKRMLGLPEDGDEDEDKHRQSRKRQQGGDDLEDDFDNEVDWAAVGAADTGAMADQAAESSEESDSGEESGESSSDEDEDSEDADAQEHFDEESSSNSEPEEYEELHPRSRQTHARDTELPYTFPCPSSHDELLDIVEGVEDRNVPTVIERIRTLHHTSFAPENKFKLQKLSGVLVDHILYLASPPEPRLSLVNLLLPHLIALCQAYPIQSAQHFIEKLSVMHKNLKRGLSHGASNPESKTWPGLPELCLLRIIGVIWPTSDMNHAVISPTRLLMAAYLELGRIRSLTDLASGLFLCTLFLQYEKLSKRFIPEVPNFLVSSLLHLAPHNLKLIQDVPGNFFSPDFGSDLCKSFAYYAKHDKGKETKKLDLMSLLMGRSPLKTCNGNLLDVTLVLIDRSANLYKSLEAFIELYGPVRKILQHIKVDRLSDALKLRLNATTETLDRLLNASRTARRPLLLQAHKPIPIPTYVPKFETSSSSYFRKQDPDHEKNEAAKLLNQYKKERKGAIRELRKDAKFLARVQQERQQEKDRTYNERMKRVFGSIESERAEQKSMDRAKQKEKKRAGKKS